MKRVLTLALSLLLCLSLLGLTPPIQHFDDVPYGHWAYDSVEAVSESGLMKGYGDRRFGPADQLTVAQVAQILCNARGDETAAANGFWAYGAVERCRDGLKCLPDLGAISAANYDVPVSRELAVYMLVNGMELQSAAVARELTLADLPDGSGIAAEYHDAVLTAYRIGLVVGTDAAGTFDPKRQLTRGEGAELFARVTSGSYRQYALKSAFARYTGRMTQQLAAGETEKNVAYSPANLYLALCMLAETSDGESRAQILDLLGLESIEQARTAANTLWDKLYRDSETGKTLLANSIWLNEQLTFHQDTVDRLANEQHASAFRVPMGDPAADAAIREWINENTNHLLEEAANGLQTDVNTRMMLISTLYFKGTWIDQFNERSTREDTFTAANGAEQKVDFMHGTRGGTYCRGENFIAAVLPFRDGRYMWFLLPDEGTAPAPETLVQLVMGIGPDVERGYADIRWSVPKFDADSDIDLIPALQTLGVTDIFDGRADFSPLTDMDTMISRAEHAVRVKVDEKGCEAAAYTGFKGGPTSAGPQPVVIEMNLNRPFAFLITGADGLPLFVGVVNTMK